MPNPLTKGGHPIAESKGTDERYTPEWVLDLVVKTMHGIDLDPCADPGKRVPASRHYTKADDGLQLPWSGRVFLNPPFSQTAAWIQHLTLYLHTEAVQEAMVLLPVATLQNKSSRAFMRSLAAAFVLFERELGFLDQEHQQLDNVLSLRSGPFALVYSGKNPNRFLEVFSPYALPCIVQKKHASEKTTMCQHCGQIFTSRRSTAKYCGTTCRVEAHRKKKLVVSG